LEIPKILINIDWKTLLEKHIEMLEKANVLNVILAVWHEKEQIKQFLIKKNFQAKIRILDVNKDDKTGRVLEIAKKFTFQDKLIVILWDNYQNNFNLTDFIYYHNTSWTNLSIVVKSQEISEGYGNIKLEWNNIVKFVEKPKNREDITYIINAWIYIIDVNIIPETWKNLKLETDFFPDYVSSSNKVKAYFHNGNWFHMQDSRTLGMFR
jgi:NDP-sugar pyrophosphorylase family protein